MKKQDIPVSSLIDMYERKELQLPEIQRQYVWRGPRVRDLLDSLYRGYPSGSILVWETNEPVPTRDAAVNQGDTPFAGRKLLLDGQQRITSLTAVLSGLPVKVKGRRKPIEILFNLEHPEGPPSEVTEVVGDEESPLLETDEGDDEEENGEQSILERVRNLTFVVSARNIAAQPNWVSVSEVFAQSNDAEILKKAGVKSFEDPRYQKYVDRLRRLRKIKDYLYVMHVLERDMSYEEVTEIFVRVNSLGAKLRSSDLALAQITSRWQNLLKLLEEFQAECETQWFTLDLGLLVRSMVVFATKQGKFDIVGNTSIDRIKKGWEQAKDGLRFAINFLRSNATIEDESLLSSPFMIIPLAIFSVLTKNKLSAEESRQLLYWLLTANAKGRYSRGSSEGLLNEDISILFRGGGPKELLEPMKRQLGRLEIDSSDFVGRAAQSPLFSVTYLALRAAGAKDWQSGLGISLTHQGKLHFIQWHHIFPKSLLKQAGYEQSEINEIANIAFISGDTNRRISNKPPEQYFPEIIKKQGKETLFAQAIPTDPELHKIDNFRKFIEKRRELLADVLNKHLGKALNG